MLLAAKFVLKTKKAPKGALSIYIKEIGIYTQGLLYSNALTSSLLCGKVIER